MRLVVLTPNDPAGPGGIERFTSTLVPLLRERGWEVEVYWPRPEDREVPAALEKVGLAPAVAALRTARRHREAIAGADAVLANGVMGWPVRHPRKAVVFHGNYAGYAKAIRSSVSSAEYVRTRYVHGGLMALGGALGTAVEVSRTAAAEIRRYYGLRRVAVIENGIVPGLLRRRRRRRGPGAPRAARRAPGAVRRPPGVPQGRRRPARAAARCCRPARRWSSPGRGRSSGPAS